MSRRATTRIVNLDGKFPIEFRAEPSPKSDIISTLQPGEIVQSDGTRGVGEGNTWQRVKILQTEGSILARHLWRTLPLSLGDAQFPLAGWCGSYEPGWSLLWNGRKLQMSADPEKYKVELQTPQSGVGAGIALISGEATWRFTDHHLQGRSL